VILDGVLVETTPRRCRASAYGPKRPSEQRPPCLAGVAAFGRGDTSASRPAALAASLLRVQGRKVHVEESCEPVEEVSVPAKHTGGRSFLVASEQRELPCLVIRVPPDRP
jgi:hypothetical protein